MSEEYVQVTPNFGIFECFQNYNAPEIFFQGLAGIIDQQDVEKMIQIQKLMLQNFEKIKGILGKYNQLSKTELQDAMDYFKNHINNLVDMKKDFDNIFHKLSTIKTKLNQAYPDACHAVNYNSGEEKPSANKNKEVDFFSQIPVNIKAKNKINQLADKVDSEESLEGEVTENQEQRKLSCTNEKYSMYNYANGSLVNKEFNVNDTESQGIKRKRRNFSGSKPKSERVLNPDIWQASIRKKLKNEGKEHFNSNAKFVPAKQVGNGCDESCRFKCNLKITLEQRKKVFEEFYKTPDTSSKWHFISQCMDMFPKKSSRENIKNSKRVFSYKYFFNVEGIKIYVCKTTFLSTLQISETPVKTVAKKKSQGTFFLPDQRGKQKNRGNKIPDETINSVVAHVNLFERRPANSMDENSKKEYIIEPNFSVKKMYELYQQWIKDPQYLNVKQASHRQYLDIFNSKFSIGFLQSTTSNK